MPPQINRLLILFAILIALFLIVRHFLVPASFGDLGHYRANSLIDNADTLLHPVKYRGVKSCEGCHDSVIALKKIGPHVNIKCETCHGPAFKHIKNPKTDTLLVPKTIPYTRFFCAKCHTKNKARNEKIIKQIDPNEHNVDMACTDCHNPHHPLKDLK